MIDKTAFITTVLQRAARLAPGHCLDLRTFKRNRSVVIVRSAEPVQDDDQGYYTVIEDGFEQNRWDAVPADALRRLLKVLLKREFPRSHKVRVYTASSLEEVDVNRMGHGAGRFGGRSVS